MIRSATLIISYVLLEHVHVQESCQMSKKLDTQTFQFSV